MTFVWLFQTCCSLPNRQTQQLSKPHSWDIYLAGIPFLMYWTSHTVASFVHVWHIGAWNLSFNPFIFILCNLSYFLQIFLLRKSLDISTACGKQQRANEPTLRKLQLYIYALPGSQYVGGMNLARLRSSPLKHEAGKANYSSLYKGELVQSRRQSMLPSRQGQIRRKRCIAELLWKYDPVLSPW